MGEGAVVHDGVAVLRSVEVGTFLVAPRVVAVAVTPQAAAERQPLVWIGLPCLAVEAKGSALVVAAAVIHGVALQVAAATVGAAANNFGPAAAAGADAINIEIDQAGVVGQVAALNAVGVMAVVAGGLELRSVDVTLVSERLVVKEGTSALGLR